ncbi:MAG: AAA family ATPase [Sandaracinaceae bacterium]|nr:AAA family ATPase [Sandaracinaceae bacterium]
MVVCVGSGGVGKTTTAASLALAAATGGKRVLVLTIDPAKRLANSLGLNEMTTEEQQIDKRLFDAAGIDCKGTLHAMMLDTKRTFDDLVTRFASSEERKNRILNNKLYQYMSSSLAGTQEYMAMEKLYSVRNDARYDLIVLDTPPTSNALDFLEAPERLVGMIDSPATRWFIDAFEGAGKFSFNLLQKGAAFLLRGLSNFTGAKFLEEVANFVVDLNDLFGGFRERAKKVSDALRSPEVAFVLVTSPSPLAIEESLYFSDKLSGANMRRTAFVINQVHALHAEPSRPESELAAELANVLGPTGTSELLERMQTALDDERARAISDRVETERLRTRGGKDTLYIEVPAFDTDVHDLRALARVASFLTGASELRIVEE